MIRNGREYRITKAQAKKFEPLNGWADDQLQLTLEIATNPSRDD